MSAVDEYGKVIDDIYDFAEAQGFASDTIIQEGGAGQVEINFLHGNAVGLTDQVFVFNRDAVRGEAYEKARALPRDLLAALDLFEDCPEVSSVLGPDFCAVYKAIKHDEIETFLQMISPWERDHLLLNV